ncbi:MAG: BglII/BstYI family type II restriction endonuclease [Chloroflexi bacterium]|nr:BglII/BstYI family type II restriction endonuclease [Chloroflexota bacterium]
MKYIVEHFFCSPRLLKNVDEISEVYSCIDRIMWHPKFVLESKDRRYEHQQAYNKTLEIEFSSYGWKPHPLLVDQPRLLGDFQKNDVFVEIQFGNSATVYRDYYKFHYGLTHNLLALAVLIVPTTPKRFFPTRASSVSNMAEFDMADRYFKLLPIPVPILLIGLLPEN